MRRTLAFAGFVLIASLSCPNDLFAMCGDGQLEQNEECDPGGVLHIDGNPNLATCTTGTDCFYELSCCKFDCQFSGQGAPCFDGSACTTNDACDNTGGCSAGASAAAGTPCDDGLACTSNDTCGNGVCMGAPPSECDDGNPCTFDICAEPSGECVNLEEPNSVCVGGGVAQLVISNRDDVQGRDKLKWRWKQPIDGTPLLLEDVGDPLGSTTHDLCVYDTTCPEPCPDPETMGIGSLRAHLSVPPGSLWRDLSSKGKFIYRDREALAGVSLFKVKMGSEPGLG